MLEQRSRVKSFGSFNSNNSGYAESQNSSLVVGQRKTSSETEKSRSRTSTLERDAGSRSDTLGNDARSIASTLEDGKQSRSRTGTLERDAGSRSDTLGNDARDGGSALEDGKQSIKPADSDSYHFPDLTIVPNSSSSESLDRYVT